MKRTVQNRTTTAAGVPVREKVTIKLVVPAWADVGQRELLKTVYADPDPTGLWSVDLEVNDDLDPAGTYYTVREFQGVIHSFTVPSGTGDVWLRDCLVVDPPALPPTGVVLPAGGVPGQVLGILPDGTLGWITPTSGPVAPRYPSANRFPSTTSFPKAA